MLVDTRCTDIELISCTPLLEGAASSAIIKIWKNKTYRFISAYCSPNPARRVQMLNDLIPLIDKDTILGGDFNCVTDTSLDLRRDSASPYSNEGADTINAATAAHNLRDETRISAGNEFVYTYI